MMPSRGNLNLSDFDCQRQATSRARFETPTNGLADVIQSFGLCAPLRDAARNGRAFRNKHAGLIELQRYKQLHMWILQHTASDDIAPASADCYGAKRLDKVAPPAKSALHPS